MLDSFLSHDEKCKKEINNLFHHEMQHNQNTALNHPVSVLHDIMPKYITYVNF